MSKTIKQWLDTEVFPLERKGGKYLAELAFSRDPARPTLNCSNKFFSPADGIILFQKEVEADEAIIEVKG
jgi:phosphatidylserine decarboxylase